jgi:methyl-accepting chemotaxis protein
MIVIVAYVIAISNGNLAFSEIRTAKLKLSENKTNALMQNILNISGDMTELIANVGDEMERLQDSVDQTVSSMVEVSTGTGESADAVQRQLLKTEDIQNYIGEVEEAGRVINENIATTNDAVNEGKQNITRMIGYTEQVDKAGNDVASALEIFKEATSKMNTITDLITNVASETSLLALNASIEAARAGDAGRGFAVVASEISGLASQTTDATDNIVALIENISSQVGSMVETIQGLITVGAEESKCAEETANSFNTIAENVAVINEHSTQLFNVINQLATANKEIVDSIQTISSITEEVTAHATETHAISEQNQSIVRDINDIVAKLNNDVATLKSKS